MVAGTCVVASGSSFPLLNVQRTALMTASVTPAAACTQGHDHVESRVACRYFSTLLLAPDGHIPATCHVHQ